MKNLAILITSLLFSLSANAVTDNSRTITSVGAANGVNYFSVTPALSSTCLYGLVYVPDAAGAVGKNYLAVMLTALSSSSVVNIDYAQPGGTGTQCNLNFITVTG